MVQFLVITSVYAKRFSSEKISPKISFEISFPASVHRKPITGRVYVMISNTNKREPRQQISRSGVPFFGSDVFNLKPGETVTIDETVLGSPVESLKDIPDGDYFVQGFVNIYTKFKRADGFVVWMHNDQWEGQRFNISPNNLYSDVKKVRLDFQKGYSIKLSATNKIPQDATP